MADWEKLTDRGHVEDRRNFTPAAFGGLSLTGLALVFLFNFLSGGTTGDVLSILQDLTPVQSDSGDFAGPDTYEVFASTVLGSANNMWTNQFAKMGEVYKPPVLVLFRQATPSACGTAASNVGPHYCYLDRTIYLDETFFDELSRRLGASGGDVAHAYVITHEAGHHAQAELGTLASTTSQESRDFSIRSELQADCFAGLWANSIKNVGVLKPGEISEALDAAAAVGDDRIQSVTTGRITPENWTHGSSEQRVTWFNIGYNSGEFDACNTFHAN